MKLGQPLAALIRQELAKHGNPDKAPDMQAYMKTDQPFFGVQGPGRKAILRDAIKKHPISSRSEYEAVILELWRGEHREEMYMGLEIAERVKAYRDAESWSFYESLMRTATNWDTLDWIVGRLMSPLDMEHREFEKSLIEWREDENFWVRRASLLAHLKHKDSTNTQLLAETILMLAHEEEFFIRKAIGWILREYSYTDSNWVESFVKKHASKLSNLSKREALKAIERAKRE